MKDERLTERFCQSARNIEEQIDELAITIKDLSERLDKLSKALLNYVRYDSDYDEQVHAEIERILDEVENNGRKTVE